MSKFTRYLCLFAATLLSACGAATQPGDDVANGTPLAGKGSSAGQVSGQSLKVEDATFAIAPLQGRDGHVLVLALSSVRYDCSAATVTAPFRA